MSSTPGKGSGGGNLQLVGVDRQACAGQISEGVPTDD